MSLRLASGVEVPVFTLGIVERLAIYDVAVDCSDVPARRSLVCFGCVGIVWELAASKEERVPLLDRSVPPIGWRPWAKCDGDFYTYARGVLETLEAAGENVMALRQAGDAISIEAFRSLNPAPERIEEARKNSRPEAATSPDSSGSDNADSGTPSPSSS